ncbi:GNAT family N-acetyltransferase [soil metagenome]
MDPGYAVSLRTPTIDEYLGLRIASGLSPKTADGSAKGLPNTLVGVVVEHAGTAVGMGRAVGDGGLFVQLVDIAVEPAHQGRGLGKAIVGALMDELRRITPPGTYVSLLADGEAHRLYAAFGFQPTAPASVGMALSL